MGDSYKAKNPPDGVLPSLEALDAVLLSLQLVQHPWYNAGTSPRLAVSNLSGIILKPIVTMRASLQRIMDSVCKATRRDSSHDAVAYYDQHQDHAQA
jgi:hypothetical protein